VTATIELAAPASSIGIDVQDLIEAEGTALALPVKVKLSNGFSAQAVISAQTRIQSRYG